MEARKVVVGREAGRFELLSRQLATQKSVSVVTDGRDPERL